MLHAKTAWRGPVSTLRTAHFLMAALLLVLGFFLIWPVLLLIINSFNTASDWFFQPRAWGLGNWVAAFTKPKILSALGNSILIWMMTIVLSFPVAVGIAWVLARTKVPYSHTLEFLFWVAFMVPDLPITIAWILLLDPGFGLINVALTKLPFMDIDKGPFNIFSIWGIVWVKLMGNTIAIKVMLLTPAFRNMDAALEEAGRVSGASNLRTALRITLPLMISPLALVFGLQLLRIFQSFETELLVGTPFNFFVLSTRVYNLVRGDAPNYGEATALASITLLVIALIIPVQRWIIQRRRYTTITGQFRPGLIDLGRWNYFFFGTDFTAAFPDDSGTSRRLAAGQLHDKGRVLPPRVHYRPLAVCPARYRVPASTAHDPGPGHYGRFLEPLVVLDSCLHPRSHSPARALRVGLHHLGFRGNSRNSLEPGTPVHLSWHTAAQLPLRDSLGIAYRCDPAREHHRR